MRDVRKRLITTTCISVRPEVLLAMRRLAVLKREARHGLGRASVSAVLADLALAELARLEAQQRREALPDA